MYMWLLLHECKISLGCSQFTLPHRQRRRQTRQHLFTLPKSPAGDVLSIIGNSGNAGDTSFDQFWRLNGKHPWYFKETIMLYCGIRPDVQRRCLHHEIYPPFRNKARVIVFVAE